MNNLIVRTLNELRAARLADREVKAHAMQRGLIATQPLSESRLLELCALGDQMREAEWRKEHVRGQLRSLLSLRKSATRSRTEHEALEASL